LSDSSCTRADTPCWVYRGSGEAGPDERREITNPRLSDRMRGLGLAEFPPVFIRRYSASFCAKHDSEGIVSRWIGLIHSAKGYLMEDPHSEPAPRKDICWGPDSRLTTQPGQTGGGGCDNIPMTRYEMYFTSPRIIRQYLVRVPEDRARFELFLML